MNKILKYFTVVLGVTVICFAPVLGTETTVGNAAGISRGSGGDVDPGTGILSMNETDLSFPKMSRLGMTIGRHYTSGQYKSSPDTTSLLVHAWGGWMGKGWSFSFAKRAFIVKFGSQLTAFLNNNVQENYKVILQSPEGFQSYVNKGNTDFWKRVKYESEIPGENGYFIEDVGILKYIGANGIRQWYGRSFYSESENKNSELVFSITGYYLTDTRELKTNDSKRIEIKYESSGLTPINDATNISEGYMSNIYNKFSLTNVVGDVYEKIDAFNNFSKDSGIASYSYNLVINRYRPYEIEDPYGRKVNFEYDSVIGVNHINEGSGGNLKEMITAAKFKSSNGTNNTIYYYYGTQGDLKKVQLTDGTTTFPATTYEYEDVSPNFKSYSYKYKGAGANITSTLYTAEADKLTQTGEITNVSGTVQDDFKGKVLNKITGSLGGITHYTWGWALSCGGDISNGRPHKVSGTYPIATSRKISGQTGDYLVNFGYPEALGGWLDLKKSYKIVSDLTGYYYSTVRVKKPVVSGVDLKDDIYSYTDGLLTEKKTEDDEFRTVLTYDNKRVKTVSAYRNTELINKTENTEFDEFSDVTVMKQYKGTAVQKVVTRTFSSRGNYNTPGLVLSEKVANEVGDQTILARYYTYTDNGVLSKVYRGLSADESKKISETTYDSDNRVDIVKTNGQSGYVDFDYSQVVGSNYQIDKKFMDGVEKYRETIEYEDWMGQIKSQTSINGQKTTYTYDNFGRPDTTTFPDLSTRRRVYDPNLIWVRTETPVGNVTETADDFGRAVIIDNPDPKSDTQMIYSTAGAVKTMKIKKPGTSIWISDHANSYDGYGRKASETSYLEGTVFKETVYTYNPVNTALKLLETQASTTFYGGSQGNVVRTSTTKTDYAGNTVERNLPGNVVNKVEYDVFGRSTGLLDGRNNQDQTDYDSENRIDLVYHRRASGTAAFSGYDYNYDSYGRLNEMMVKHDAHTGPSGTTYQTFNYYFDNFGRTTETKLNLTNQETLTYDEITADNGKGQLTKTENGDSITKFNYDTMGRLKKEETTIKRLNNKVISIEEPMDTLGRVTGVIFPDQKSIGYVYDLSNKTQLKKITYNGSEIIKSMSYTPDGKLADLILGNNFTINYQYKKDIFIDKVSAKNGAGVTVNIESYTYGANGNVSKLTEADVMGPGKKMDRIYTYNDKDELTGAAVQSNGTSVMSYTYGYDLNGNMTTSTIPQATSSTIQSVNTIRTYNDELTQKSYANQTGLTLSYDPKGNVTNKTWTTASTQTKNQRYVYNYQDQISQVYETPQAGSEELRGEYGYNTKRERIYQKAKVNGIWSEKFYYWDFEGRIVGEGTPNQDYSVRYIYLGNEKIAMIRNEAGTEKVYYFLNNAQGTPSQIVDSNGTTVHRQRLEEWGNIEAIQGSQAEVNYTGKKKDPVTGFAYFGQRYYDPELGRFMSHDPAGQSLNPYMYCANSPLVYTDPDGEFWWLVGMVIGGWGKDLTKIETWIDIAIGGFTFGVLGDLGGLSNITTKFLFPGLGAYIGLEMKDGMSRVTAGTDYGEATLFDFNPYERQAKEYADKAREMNWDVALSPVDQSETEQLAFAPALAVPAVMAAQAAADTFAVYVGARMLMAKPPGADGDWSKLRRDQGWRDPSGNTWKWDQKHKNHAPHWDVSNRRGEKVREVEKNGRQIWPGGPKNKNKK